MAEWSLIIQTAPMTADAKSLTSTATTRTRVRQAPLTSPMADARTFANALGHLGHDVDALLSDVGLTRAELNRPDARVACDVVGAMLGRAQQKRFTPNLGLAIAQATPVGGY